MALPLVGLVPGFKFYPSDQELLGYFLYLKIMGLNIPLNVVVEADLYGDKNPWDIWDDFGKSMGAVAEELFPNDRYFFTRLKKKSAGGKRIDRTVGFGSWEGEDSGKKVMAGEEQGRGVCMGSKKRFRFEKSRTENDGGWIMHEYTLDPRAYPPNISHHIQNSLYTLCLIRKNPHHVKKQKSQLKRNQDLKRWDIDVHPHQVNSNVVVNEEKDNVGLEETGGEEIGLKRRKVSDCQDPNIPEAVNIDEEDRAMFELELKKAMEGLEDEQDSTSFGLDLNKILEELDDDKFQEFMVNWSPTTPINSCPQSSADMTLFDDFEQNNSNPIFNMDATGLYRE